MENNKIFVVGANGNFGRSLRAQFAKSHQKVVAISRSPVEDLGYEHETRIQADAKHPASWSIQAQQGDIICYAVNPKYSQWQTQALDTLNAICNLAQSRKLSIFFPANVYQLPVKVTMPVNEQFEAVLHTPLSKIRFEMEQRLVKASNNGAQVVLVRAGDFIADRDYNQSTWFKHLVSIKKNHCVVRTPGDADLLHTWAYLPDLADTFAKLINQRHSLPAMNCFHYQGLEFSLNQLSGTLARVLKRPVKQGYWSWNLLKLISIFDANLKGVVQMRYLWQNRLALDDTKLKLQLGKPMQVSHHSLDMMIKNLEAAQTEPSEQTHKHPIRT